jgi:hypothetical protein
MTWRKILSWEAPTFENGDRVRLAGERAIDHAIETTTLLLQVLQHYDISREELIDILRQGRGTIKSVISPGGYEFSGSFYVTWDDHIMEDAIGWFGFRGLDLEHAY